MKFLFILIVILACLQSVSAANCVAGKYSPTADNGNDENGCTNCSTGKWTSAEGTSGASDAVCTTCAAGYGGDGSAGSACTGCTTGKFSSATTDTNACVDCDLRASATCGLAEDGSNNSVAGTCDAAYSGTAVTDGNGTTAGSSGCANCAAGYGGDGSAGSACTGCTTGKFSSATTDTNACVDCDLRASATCGLADDGSNNSVAGSCDAGYSGTAVTDGNGTGCTACPQGKFKTASGDGDENSVCTACTGGKYTSGTATTGADEAAACTTCAAGYGGASCTGCTLNTYSSATTDKSECLACDTKATTTCGLASDGSDNSVAGSCDAGYYGLAHTDGTVGTGCTACPQGKFKTASGDGDENSVCTACTGGKYTSGTATTGADEAAACTTCAAGYGGASCTGCTLNTYSSATADKSECLACDTKATTTCGLASDGSDNSVAGSCDAGYYGLAHTDGTVGTGCTACPQGKFKTASGNVDCTACDTNASTCGGVSAGTCDAGYKGSAVTDGSGTGCSTEEEKSLWDFSEAAVWLVIGAGLIVGGGIAFGVYQYQLSNGALKVATSVPTTDVEDGKAGVLTAVAP